MAEKSPRDYFRTKKRYAQVGHLGRGGMAIVSESKDEYFQRNIAYKKLKPGPGLSKRTEEFVREALIMGKLEHPGVLPIHELIEDKNDTAAITMNKVSGLSLAEKISEAKKDPASWPFEERIRQFQKLVETVAYSHSRSVLHRDIKPANVMIGEFGEVILLDWGLAKVTQSKEKKNSDDSWNQDMIDGSKSVTGSIKGTPFYMSPEAAAGKTKLVKESSDVFGLGAVLYEFITLSYLIKGNKALDVLKHASQGDYHPTHLEYLNDNIKADVQKVPEELHYILKRSIAINPEDRYRDASEFNQDLLNYLNDMPIQGFGSFPYKTKKWIQRNGFWVLIMIIPIFLTTFAYKKLDIELKSVNENLKAVEFRLTESQKELKNIELKKARASKKIENMDLSIASIQENMLKEEDQFLSSQDEIAVANIKLEIEQKKLKELESINDIRRYQIEEANEKLEKVREELNKFKEKEQIEKQYNSYKEFLKDTVPYGNQLIEIRKDVEFGNYWGALRKINSNVDLKIDPYAVKWMRSYIVMSQLIHHGKKDQSPWNKLEAASIKWSEQEDDQTDILDEVDYFSEDMDFLDIGKGYRIIEKSNIEGPWLIGFVSVLRSRFKNINPNTGERTETWMLMNDRHLNVVSDEAQGWVMLTENGQLYSMRPGLPMRPMRPLERQVRAFFKVGLWNLGISQEQDGRVNVYYLNTGQFLFSPGSLERDILSVRLDAKMKLHFQVGEDEWMTPKSYHPNLMIKGR
jgi:serine/threonine protein kinase